MICKYTTGVYYRYLEILEENGLQLTTEGENWELFLSSWGADIDQGFGSIENTAGKYVWGLPGNRGFINRKSIWINLVNYVGREKASHIMPDTYILGYEPNEKAMLEQYPDQKMIIKNRQQRREGIKIVQNAAEALAVNEDHTVAQKLITDLVKWKDTVFNLRCYLLLTFEKNILTTYLYHDALTIWAQEEEAKPEFEGVITHVTTPVPDGFPFYLSHLCEVADVNYKAVFIAIAKAINTVIRSTSKQFHFFENLKDAHCFQHYGFDVIIRENWEPLICEINKGPDMTTKNEYEEVLKNGMLNDILAIAGIRNEENVGFIQIDQQEVDPIWARLKESSAIQQIDPTDG